MQCAVCGRPAESALVGLGGYCSEVHLENLRAEQKRVHDELLGEPVDVMPEVFTVADFDRYALKFALHWLRAMSKGDRAKLQGAMIWLRDPGQLALYFKDVVLAHVPAGYTSCLEQPGAARLFVSETYQFRIEVPKGVVLEAISKAGLSELLQ